MGEDQEDRFMLGSDKQIAQATADYVKEQLTCCNGIIMEDGGQRVAVTIVDNKSGFYAGHHQMTSKSSIGSFRQKEMVRGSISDYQSGVQQGIDIAFQALHAQFAKVLAVQASKDAKSAERKEKRRQGKVMNERQMHGKCQLCGGDTETWLEVVDDDAPNAGCKDRWCQGYSMFKDAVTIEAAKVGGKTKRRGRASRTTCHGCGNRPISKFGCVECGELDPLYWRYNIKLHEESKAKVAAANG